MPELIVAILFFLAAIGVALVLPILSLFFTRRALLEIRALRARIDALEAQRPAPDVPPAAVPTPLAAVPPPPAPRAPEIAAPPLPSIPTSQPTGAAPPPPAVPPHPAAPPRPAPTPASRTLEQTIGSRWLLYAGIAAVVLGVSYFVKYAFDNGWISEPLRVATGVAAGFALIVAGLRFHTRGLAVFGQALAGGGVAILYLAIYAALHFYFLIGRGTAFAAMAAVTAGAAFLADRLRAQPLAALALIGGFVTPGLIGGGRGDQVVLFTYIAILISGAALMVRRRRWPLIGAGAYLGTIGLVNAWFASSYRPELWLQTELFLTLYVALFIYMLWWLLRGSPRPDPVAGMVAVVVGTAPLTYHVASVFLLDNHPEAWLVYAVLATAVALAIAQRLRVVWLRIAVLMLVGLPMLAFIDDLRARGLYPASIVVLLVIYAMHLAAHLEAAAADAPADGSATAETRKRHRLAAAAYAQLNGLLLAAALYSFFEERYAEWTSWIVAALAVWNAALAVVLQRLRDVQRQHVALSATLAATALVLAFDGPAVAVGWAAEGVCLGWLALRERSRLFAVGAVVLTLMGTMLLLSELGSPLPAADMPVINARAFAAALVIALLAALAWRLRGEPPAAPGAGDAVIVVANILGVALVSSEVQGYFDQRALDGDLLGESGLVIAATFAERAALSVSWALYALALVAIGIRRHYAPARYFGIALFALTLVKVAQDIARLDRFYQMLSALLVGILLLLASYLYQRTSAAAVQEDA